MKKVPAYPRNVVVVLHLSHASHRDILHGISRNAVWGDRWSFRVVDYALLRDGAPLRDILAEWADGVICAGLDEATVKDALTGWRGPVVAVATPQPEAMRPPTGAAFVGLDERAIGRAGADFLCSLGRFRSFGFVRGSWRYNASMRAEGFVDRLRGRGAGVRVFAPDEQTGLADPTPLSTWLRALPRPRAVMANSDGAAVLVAASAAAARLRIPRDMALLGCDNDELLCESASPTLTSLAPDHVRLGEMAAMALRKLFANPQTPYFEEYCDAVRVVERQSARPVAPAAALAERAEAFIRQEAAKGARVADVVAHLGVSRSLADLRYREVFGETMRDAILRLRLEAVKRKLRETDMSVGQVASSCGFRSEAHARRLFHARFGCSMREWRRATREGRTSR